MMIAMAMVARAMATATRVWVSDNKGNGGGVDCGSNEGGKQQGG
jgi:hypothetical protein